MKIKVKLHPNSSQEKISQIDEKDYEVWIKEKPIDNKANASLIKILKKHFRKNIEIKSGFKGRNKVVELK